MSDPLSIKKTHTLSALNLILSDIDNRQAKGLLTKKMGALEKNAIAMKFVDLH